jgi:hypothetical protein
MTREDTSSKYTISIYFKFATHIQKFRKGRDHNLQYQNFLTLHNYKLCYSAIGKTLGTLYENSMFGIGWVETIMHAFITCSGFPVQATLVDYTMRQNTVSH